MVTWSAVNCRWLLLCHGRLCIHCSDGYSHWECSDKDLQGQCVHYCACWHGKCIWCAAMLRRAVIYMPQCVGYGLSMSANVLMSWFDCFFCFFLIIGTYHILKELRSRHYMLFQQFVENDHAYPKYLVIMVVCHLLQLHVNVSAQYVTEFYKTLICKQKQIKARLHTKIWPILHTRQM